MQSTLLHAVQLIGQGREKRLLLVVKHIFSFKFFFCFTVGSVQLNALFQRHHISKNTTRFKFSKYV